MIDATKDIVIALINSKQIANTSDTNKNIEEIKNAIKEIYKQLQNSKYGN